MNDREAGMSTDKEIPFDAPPKELPPKERAINILQEAISGTSPKSKNSLIKDAIRCLKA